MTDRPTTILVVEDNAVTRKLFRVTLEGAGYRVVEAGDGRAALELVPRETPDLILQDLRLPDTEGGELAERIRALPQGPEVTIIAVSGLLSAIEAGRLAGSPFDDFLAKPVEPSRLLETVGAHLAAPLTAPAPRASGRRIVIADDDPMQRKLLALRLSHLGFTVDAAGDGAAALERVLREPPDAVVSDVLMPRLDGFGLCLAVRRDPRSAHVPVVLASSSYVEQADRELAAKAGADAYVLRTPDFREVIDALQESLRRPRRPVPAQLPDAIAGEHFQRVLRQLERQAARNVTLAERNALLTAELASLAGISEVLSRVRDSRAAAREILATCLEAGGISTGALYLDSPTGGFRDVTAIGFPDALRDEVEDFFGHTELLGQLAAERSVVTIPSDAAPPAAARVILKRSGLTRLLVAAVPIHGAAPAVLVLGSSGKAGPDEGVRAGFARTVAVQIGQALSLTRALGERDLLLESAGEGICGVDREGRAMFVNTAAAHMLGCRPEELMGRALHAVVHPHERGGAAADCALASAVQEGLRRTGQDTFRHHEGTLVPVQYSVAPIIDGVHHAGAVLIFRDVTHEKQLEEQLRLAQKMEAVGTLAGGVAHDFNNLLAAIRSTVDLALMDLDTEHPVRGDLGEVAGLVDRGAALTRQLLAFGRRQIIEPRAVNLNALVSGTATMVERIIGEDIRLTQYQTSDPTTVLVDPGQIEQVLMNLCANARDAMPGGGELTILTERVQLDERFPESHPWARPGDYVRLTVSDTGTGMDAATQARLFEPFFTTKEVGRGTGLGLAVVYGIVKQHRGLIHVHSESGKGSVFWIYLPCHIGVAEEPESADETEPVAGTETLLVAEDDDVLRVTTTRLLARLGYRIMAAANGREALEALTRHGDEIDLAVLDVVMPEVPGPAVIEQVRPRHPGMRFLLTTGYAPGTSQMSPLRDLPATVLAKPYGLRELARAVRRALDAAPNEAGPPHS